MILIVNTTANTDLTNTLKEHLTENKIDFEVIDAASMNISPCLGCNQCWLKTPGICTIKDDYEKILKKLPLSDQFWVITETAFGFMDHKGKNIFDRIVPILNIYLEFRGNQMKHILRYDKRTNIGLIYQGNANKEYFSKWNKRCTEHLDCKSLGIYSIHELKEAISCMQ